jgi:Nif-specific regulatory protein
MLTRPLRLSESRAHRAKSFQVIVDGLYSISKALVATPTQQHPLEHALEVLTTFLELRASFVAIFDDDGELQTIPNQSARDRRIPAMQPLARAAASRVKAIGVPWVVESVWVELNDVNDLAALWEDTDLDASLVAVPIRTDGKVAGALAILREHSPGDQADFCFDDDIPTLVSVARLIELAQRANVVGREDGDRDATTSGPPPSCGIAPTSGVGTSAPWRETLRRALVAGRTNATVMLRGETGVGKNVVARTVHDSSLRRERPFIVVNCAALAATLLESELFGHEKGAFTGATSQRKGRFELADGGTLFLDEIGEISETFQAKLLRVVQVGEFERIGGATTLQVDVRIVAATHRDLEAAVRDGSFRADLYYRLCVVPIMVPPLRDRPDDILLLARTFLDRFNDENGTLYTLGASAISVLMSYAYPGNVRELENAVRRAASLASHVTLTGDDFAFLRAEPGTHPPPSAAQHRPLSADAGPSEASRPDAMGRSRLVDRERLIEALERTGWVMTQAARVLGITPRQVGYAVQQHRINLRRY